MRRSLLFVAFALVFLGLGTPAESMTPTEILEVMTRAADWQLAHSQGEPGDWTNAVFYSGLMAAHRATGEARYLEELVGVGERLGWQPGARYRHADDHAIAQTYLEIFELRGDLETISPFKGAIDRMMATPPDWEKGHQVIDYWWSDALFMSPPALVALAKATGDDEYLDFMDELWRQSYDLLWDEESRLFYRDTRFRERSPGEFWSRGNAWVLAGLARMLDDVPEDRPARRFYLEVFQKMAEKVVAIQPEDGLWRSDLLESSLSVPGETSGTALFCYALAWGVRTGVLERDLYLPAIEKSWIVLTRSVYEDGRLGWVQKPGASPDRVRASHWATYGTGAFLHAGSEMLKLVED